MGFLYRRRVRIGRRAWLNISTKGVSASARAGRITSNTRGRTTVRLLHGLSWRKG